MCWLNNNNKELSVNNNNTESINKTKKHLELQLLFDEIVSLNAEYSKKLNSVLERIKIVGPSNKEVIVYESDVKRSNTPIIHYEKPTSFIVRKRGISSPPKLNTNVSIIKDV